MDGEVREVQAIDHIAQEELNVQEDNSQTVHLISNPEISKVNIRKGGNKNTNLEKRGKKERVWGGDGRGGGGGMGY